MTSRRKVDDRRELVERILNGFPTEEEEKRRLKELGEKMNAAGIQLNFKRTPNVPDHPPCDFCGKEYSGKFQCAGCKCVAYCSEECQNSHWKKHRKECSTMNQQCEEIAQKFVDTINDTNCSIFKKMDHDLWTSLDKSNPYKKALAKDLNGIIRCLLEDEGKHIERRFQSGIFLSYTQMLMCNVFRNGRNIPGGVFKGIDASRIKKYVLSSDDAFERWFETSLKIIKIFANIIAAVNTNRNMDDSATTTTFWQIQKIARDISCCWCLVFISSKASEAILLGGAPKKEPDDIAHNRVKWIIKQLGRLLPLFPSTSPDGKAVEGLVNQVAAMIDLRCEMLGFNLGDFDRLLRLKGTAKRMYNDTAIPWAEAAMTNGRLLTTDESQHALLAYAKSGRRRRRKETVTSTSAKGSKKKGKKGKGGRK